MTEPKAHPLAFGAAERPLFGFLHVPVPGAPARDLGLVICKPFGYEAICAHRSLRHIADASATLGIPALRFDYDGTGDSAGDDRDPGRWDAWCRSVHQAIDEIRRHGQVDRVYLLGIRLGATLAAATAAERDDVAGLIAIAPVVKGRTWLRELHALEIAMGFAGPPSGHEDSNGYKESVGFVITDETRASLESIDLVAMSRPPAADVLILERDDLASNVKWAERLGALGASVDQRRVAGYADMMLEPHESIVPAKMIAQVAGWLEHRAVSTRVARDIPSYPPMVGPNPVATGVEETAGYLDAKRTLFGVVSTPKGGTPRPNRALLLLNAGAISHIGPSRMYVDMARRWAARGYLVLRVDQPGIGDSQPVAGETENVVYSPSAIRGVADALTYLRDVWGVTECQAIGICSGAYHAFKAAVAGLPLKGVAVVNPLVFFWKSGMSLASSPHRIAGDVARYKQSFLEFDKWQKLLSGKVSVRSFARVMARRGAARATTVVRDIARAAGRPLPHDLGTELESVANRGVALRFVFATGDPGADLLSWQAGSSLKRLLRDQRLRIQQIDGPDHSFTRVWTRALLHDVLEAELELQ